MHLEVQMLSAALAGVPDEVGLCGWCKVLKGYYHNDNNVNNTNNNNKK